MTRKGMKTAAQVTNIGVRLRRLRKDRGFTQCQLARQIGIQQSDLSRIEKGEYRVSLDNLFKMLAVFGVKASEFFSDQKKPQPAAPAPLMQNDMQVLQVLRQLSPEARDEVQEFAEFKLRRERAEKRRLDFNQQQEQGG
jgi:transcriptional regulator with XRE-family HTH domain